jgi:acetyl esterase/lipase
MSDCNNFPMHLPMRFGPPPGEHGLVMPEADVSFVKRKYLDIPYASFSEAEKLDIYLPSSGDGPFPVLLQIHGGGFEIGDKRDIHVLPFLKAIERGLAVVSINYRLSGEAIFPAAVQDVKAAVRWIRANQAQYQLDGNRITACGGSAGANLAAILGVTGNSKEFDNPKFGNMVYPSNVQAVVDWFGPIDFLTMDEQAIQNGFGLTDHCEQFSPESKYLGAPIREIPEKVKSANPTTYIHPGMPPFFIQHGSDDYLVPVQQSINFAKAITDRFPENLVQLEIIDHAGHGDPQFETDRNLEKVFTFIETTMIIVIKTSNGKGCGGIG